MRVVVVAALAVCVVLLGAPTSVAATGPINVTATRTSSVSREIGRPGRVGNAVQQSWQLNDRRGRPVGRMLLSCRWIVADARYCSGEINMPLGKITVAGSSFTGLLGEYAVTGGTERYVAASGVMNFTAIGARKQVLFISLT